MRCSRAVSTTSLDKKVRPFYFATHGDRPHRPPRLQLHGRQALLRAALAPLGFSIRMDWPDRHRAYFGLPGEPSSLWLFESPAAGSLELLAARRRRRASSRASTRPPLPPVRARSTARRWTATAPATTTRPASSTRTGTRSRSCSAAPHRKPRWRRSIRLVQAHVEHDAVVELIKLDPDQEEHDAIRELWKAHSARRGRPRPARADRDAHAGLRLRGAAGRPPLGGPRGRRPLLRRAARRLPGHPLRSDEHRHRPAGRL